jgi:hypothetical protein
LENPSGLINGIMVERGEDIPKNNMVIVKRVKI